MKSTLIMIGCATLGLFAVNGYAQDGIREPNKLTVIKDKLASLSSRYKEKCESEEFKTERQLLLIEQGAALEGGLTAPVANQIVFVLRSIREDIKADYCDRSKDLREITDAIGPTSDDETDQKSP